LRRGERIILLLPLSAALLPLPLLLLPLELPPLRRTLARLVGDNDLEPVDPERRNLVPVPLSDDGGVVENDEDPTVDADEEDAVVEAEEEEVEVVVVGVVDKEVPEVDTEDDEKAAAEYEANEVIVG